MSRISSDHPEFCDSSRRRKQDGFTLVELLVSIGIIVLLLAILMPILGRVREAGRRTKCAANLHTIGQMATTFANDHRGFFPACYRMNDTASATYPFRVPQFINVPYLDPSTGTIKNDHDSDDSQYGWQQYGTSWTMWQRYNATLDVFTCPSVDTPAHEIDLATSSSQAQYGNFISSNYMYLGGLSDQNMAVPPHVSGGNHSTGHWAKAPPAVAIGGSPLYVYQVDPNDSTNVIDVQVGMASLGQTVLAADLVYYGGTSTSVPVYKINHPVTGNPKMPDFQNVLYGDGRVEGHGPAEYPLALNDDTGGTGSNPKYSYNWSMKFASGQAGFYYWGEPESTPLMTGVQPPPTDAIPGTTDPNATTGSAWVQPKYLPPNPVVANPPTEPPTEGNPGALPG
ncbi:MAG TPA: type II secretion system protein [Tepidisphaeraceae bacterium]|jgi:prepilin-type N-terminal cleavage/methylation domain-containing protein|nr:type II secretion system protein [Tepidisphaeraceae bacterium]